MGIYTVVRLTRTRWVFCWQPLPHLRVGASGDCLQASATGGFGLPTPAEWTHSVSCWQSLPSDSPESGGPQPPPAEARNFPLRSPQAATRKNTCDLRSLGPAGAAGHSNRLVCSEQIPPGGCPAHPLGVLLAASTPESPLRQNSLLPPPAGIWPRHLRPPTNRPKKQTRSKSPSSSVPPAGRR